MAFIAKRLPLGDRISPALATELELALHIVSACFSAGLNHKSQSGHDVSLHTSYL